MTELKVPTDGKGFWVGKKSLNNWKRLAKNELAIEIDLETRMKIEEQMEDDVSMEEVNIKKWKNQHGVPSK